MLDHGRFERLGGTRDDAAGEAFDKVARLLDLGYPGGPPLSRLAATAEDRALRLPRAWLPGSDDFSFSGLKTAVAQRVAAEPDLPPAEVAHAFEESVADVLSRKAARIAEREGVACLLVAGGVAANGRLREAVREASPVPVFIPPPVLCTDNAAMIGAAAYRHLDDAVAPESELDIFPHRQAATAPPNAPQQLTRALRLRSLLWGAAPPTPRPRRAGAARRSAHPPALGFFEDAPFSHVASGPLSWGRGRG